MRNRIGKWLVVVVLVVVTGGHWAILQSLAWVGMFVSFTQHAPVSVALQKTFDGKHPCPLCKAVQAGKEAQKHQETQQPERKFDFWLVAKASLTLPEIPLWQSGPEVDSVPSRTEQPSIPPPKQV